MSVNKIPAVEAIDLYQKASCQQDSLRVFRHFNIAPYGENVFFIVQIL